VRPGDPLPAANQLGAPYLALLRDVGYANLDLNSSIERQKLTVICSSTPLDPELKSKTQSRSPNGKCQGAFSPLRGKRVIAYSRCDLESNCRSTLLRFGRSPSTLMLYGRIEVKVCVSHISRKSARYGAPLDSRQRENGQTRISNRSIYPMRKHKWEMAKCIR
jgi:hypothetical protein